MKRDAKHEVKFVFFKPQIVQSLMKILSEPKLIENCNSAISSVEALLKTLSSSETIDKGALQEAYDKGSFRYIESKLFKVVDHIAVQKNMVYWDLNDFNQFTSFFNESSYETIKKGLIPLQEKMTEAVKAIKEAMAQEKIKNTFFSNGEKLASKILNTFKMVYKAIFTFASLVTIKDETVTRAGDVYLNINEKAKVYGTNDQMLKESLEELDYSFSLESKEFFLEADSSPGIKAINLVSSVQSSLKGFLSALSSSFKTINSSSDLIKNLKDVDELEIKDLPQKVKMVNTIANKEVLDLLSNDVVGYVTKVAKSEEATRAKPTHGSYKFNDVKGVLVYIPQEYINKIEDNIKEIDKTLQDKSKFTQSTIKDVIAATGIVTNVAKEYASEVSLILSNLKEMKELNQ